MRKALLIGTIQTGETEEAETEGEVGLVIGRLGLTKRVSQSLVSKKRSLSEGWIIS